MKKINMFKTKKELNELKESYNDYKKYVERKFEELKAELFNLKYPIGLITYSWRCWSNYLYVGIDYVFESKIKGTRLYTDNKNIPYSSYKIVVKDKYIYVGLKFEDKERYFVVDMSDSKSIECTNQDIMNTATWVAVSE